MSQVFDTLQDRYRELVEESFASAVNEPFLDRIRSFLQDARQAGAVVIDPEERGLLRTYMRFMVTQLGQAGEELPEIDLLPIDRERWPEPFSNQRSRRSVPLWVWGLAGGAAVVILAGLVAVAGLSLGGIPFDPSPTPLPSQTARPPTQPPSPTAPPTPTPSPPPSPTPRPGSPLFSDLTVALGMLSPTEPWQVGNDFQWYTRAVYAIFDYQGMQDGTAWSVVWTRDGEEVAQENHLWDTEQDEQAGTRWAVLFNPEGLMLPSGNYVVSLYIQGELQDAVSFLIRFYPTPTP